MALVIRLREQGRNNSRSFRLVVADVRSPRDGKYVENLGFYDPHGDNLLEVNSERVQYWLDQGALISDNAKNLVAKKAPEVIKAFNAKKVAKKLKLSKKRKEATK